MLKLGIEAEESCNPMARAVGTEVLKLFPEELVKHYKTTAKNKEEGQKNYAHPFIHFYKQFQYRPSSQ